VRAVACGATERTSAARRSDSASRRRSCRWSAARRAVNGCMGGSWSVECSRRGWLPSTLWSAGVVVADGRARIGAHGEGEGAQEAEARDDGPGDENEGVEGVHGVLRDVARNHFGDVFRLLLKITHLRVTCQAVYGGYREHV